MVTEIPSPRSSRPSAARSEVRLGPTFAMPSESRITRLTRSLSKIAPDLLRAEDDARVERGAAAGTDAVDARLQLFPMSRPPTRSGGISRSVSLS